MTQLARLFLHQVLEPLCEPLDALPEFTCLQGIPRSEIERYLHGAISISPNIDHLERAYDDAKYGDFSQRPFMDITIPSLIDPTMAPPGKHVINLFGGHAPYTLKDSDWGQEREAFRKTVFDTVDEVAPGFSNGVIDSQLLLPPDIERIINSPQGHIFHGELSLEQLFFQRPAPGYSDYRSPVTGLYQCGSSTHPGGGVSAIPGHNAAREILRDWRRLPK